MTNKLPPLVERALPKWPRMLVTGSRVTGEQALEIIRRTDQFFQGDYGNDRGFAREVMERLGMPREMHPLGMGEELRDPDWSAERRWQEGWGYLPTRYIYNRWVSSSFVHGPTGWCAPDGTIAFPYNVGKWPTVSEILEDWELMAGAFPYLSLDVTLGDQEWGEEGIQEVVGFRVRGGRVEVVDPGEVPLHVGRPSPEVAPYAFSTGSDYLLAERGISPDILREWEIRSVQLGLSPKLKP